jgi:hypothetical protein
VLASRLPSGWLFFDPAVPNLPFGMLLPAEEGSAALIADPKGMNIIECSISGPEKTQTRRTARLKLAEDGTLEGDISVDFTGQENALRKQALRRRTAEEIADLVKRDLEQGWQAAEIANVQVRNTNESAPLTISYSLRVPGYAERTGRRMFLRPSVFRANTKPRFTGNERRHPVQFDHAWSELDIVSIELPAGFSLDNATAPASLSLGPVGDYKVELGYDSRNSKLHYKRDFVFGRRGHLVFPQTLYGELNKAFEAIQAQDNHSVAVRQEASRVE